MFTGVANDLTRLLEMWHTRQEIGGDSAELALLELV